MLLLLSATAAIGLLFGVVYPAVMAVIWLLFWRHTTSFRDFLKSI